MSWFHLFNDLRSVPMFASKEMLVSTLNLRLLNFQCFQNLKLFTLRLIAVHVSKTEAAMAAVEEEAEAEEAMEAEEDKAVAEATMLDVHAELIRRPAQAQAREAALVEGGTVEDAIEADVAPTTSVDPTK